jgi:hypothetical protein
LNLFLIYNLKAYFNLLRKSFLILLNFSHIPNSEFWGVTAMSLPHLKPTDDIQHWGQHGCRLVMLLWWIGIMIATTRMCESTKCTKHSVQAKKTLGTYFTECDTWDKTLGICCLDIVFNCTQCTIQCTECFQNTMHKPILGTKLMMSNESKCNDQFNEYQHSV